MRIPLNNIPELKVYQKYKKGQPGMTYHPHHYDLKSRRSKNSWLHPEILPASHIKYRTTLDLEQYWRFCELLAQNGVTNGKCMSIPAKALLTLNRIRLGSSLEHLATLFQVDEPQFLNDTFWEVAMILYNNTNDIQRMWIENITDCEKDRFIESYFNSLDPLYQNLCENVQGN